VSAQVAAPADTEPNEARYRWLLVDGLSITVTVTYGVLVYAFGVLLPAMQHDLSRAPITLGDGRRPTVYRLPPAR
jgi:hypothetical protein